MFFYFTYNLHLYQLKWYQSYFYGFQLNSLISRNQHVRDRPRSSHEGYERVTLFQFWEISITSCFISLYKTQFSFLLMLCLWLRTHFLKVKGNYFTTLLDFFYSMSHHLFKPLTEYCHFLNVTITYYNAIKSKNTIN